MNTEQAIQVLNAHRHRGTNEWALNVHGEVAPEGSGIRMDYFTAFEAAAVAEALLRMRPAIGDHLSIPTPIRDCVEVVTMSLVEGWFKWRSLTCDAEGTFPLNRLSECWPLCEHMNDAQVCAECEA